MGRGAGEGFAGCGGGGEDGGGGGGEGGEGWGEEGWGEGEWVALVGGREVGGLSWSMRGGLSDNDTMSGVLGRRGHMRNYMCGGSVLLSTDCDAMADSGCGANFV